MDRLGLNGRWLVRRADEGNEKWFAAVVPGCMHTDLLAAGEIVDPFYGDNELQVMWIWLEAEEDTVRFSDNFFHLRPGRPVTVTVSGAGPETARGVGVSSLVDTYSK